MQTLVGHSIGYDKHRQIRSPITVAPGRDRLRQEEGAEAGRASRSLIGYDECQIESHTISRIIGYDKC